MLKTADNVVVEKGMTVYFVVGNTGEVITETVRDMQDGFGFGYIFLKGDDLGVERRNLYSNKSLALREAANRVEAKARELLTVVEALRQQSDIEAV